MSSSFIENVDDSVVLEVLKGTILGLYAFIRGPGREELVQQYGEYEAEIQIQGFELAVSSLVNTGRMIQETMTTPAEQVVPPVDQLRAQISTLFNAEA